ncbi:carboxymethylenebutenolidase [Pedococcus cremeus]|uniref:Carboxymethylenebutenolidase n=1 Tax=Pedococcus cremeus TaxID=587636 RepID=A0A1H9XR38_9MICO|nr:dienelactone hydrolase family protein [Pedococcus cremeus]SES48489.1 carboxymethylenebutenolidase [Pedococcus cremeus]
MADLSPQTSPETPLETTAATLDVPTADGAADALFVTPATGGPHPGVVMFMDAFGLRPRLEEMASRLAGQGYAVLVPNVFWRSGRAPVVELPDLSDPLARGTVFERLGPVMKALTPELATRDADAWLDFLARDERVADGPVGALGYCMGGALAIRLAAHAPERVAAVATFHAGRLVTDAPDSPHRLFGRLGCEVYVAHADHDHSMSPEHQQVVGEALASAGVEHRTELYEGAAHGFTMADTAAYDDAATERHWEALLDLFARRLPQPARQSG